MSEVVDLKYKSLKEILISIFVGFSIGLSIIVPGISGSTIAIIMKVYDKMMYAFSNLFKKFKICVLFLIPIGVGIALGFVLGFLLVKLLLELFPFITICFFVGLMIGTFPILFKEIKGEKANTNGRLLFVAGILVPLLIILLSMFIGGDNALVNLNVGNYILFVVIGVLMSLTQIIPGLSATVLLMMFGYYTAILNGVGTEMLKDFKLLLVYICIIIGFAIGILLFSKVINFLLEKKRRMFFHAICGLSVGSVLSVFFGNECIDIYSKWNVQSAITDLIVGIIALAIGFAITFALYIYDKKRAEKENI